MKKLTAICDSSKYWIRMSLSKTLNHCMHVQWLLYWMWTSTIWPRCEVKCLCCSAVQWWRCATGKAMLSYSKYWIWNCFVFIYLLPSSGCCWLFSSEAKFRPIVQCNFIIKVIGAEIWRAASSCCMHHCLNQSVSLGMLNLSFYCTWDKQWFV